MNPKHLTAKEKVRRAQILTRKYITSKHLHFLNRWQKRLGLRNEGFDVYVFDSRWDPDTVARITYSVTESGRHAMGLSTKTLKSTDWRDSIVHELLHAKIYTVMKGARRKIPEKREEELVCTLTPLMVRR